MIAGRSGSNCTRTPRPRQPLPAVLERVRAGDDDPRCLDCGGILKSDTISFGQALAAELLERAFAAAARCDLMLAAGTTLHVYPVAGTVEAAHVAGARVVILNDQPTGLDGLARALLRGPIGEWLPRLCE